MVACGPWVLCSRTRTKIVAHKNRFMSSENREYPVVGVRTFEKGASLTGFDNEKKNQPSYHFTQSAQIAFKSRMYEFGIRLSIEFTGAVVNL